MAIRSRAFALLVILLPLLAGCASTSLQSAWYDSTYDGQPFKRILVVGVTGGLTDRLVFDDMFAQMLNSAGVQGIPGYRFIDNAPSATEAELTAGVAQSGADGLLLVRLLGVDTRAQVQTTMVPGMYAAPFGGPFGYPMGMPGFFGSWGSVWYAAPDVLLYQVANVEATLFDGKTHRPIWSATTKTVNPTSVAAETPGYAKLVIGQLSARGLLANSK